MGGGGVPKLGVPFWGPYKKDYSIWVSIVGYLFFFFLNYDTIVEHAKHLAKLGCVKEFEVSCHDGFLSEGS